MLNIDDDTEIVIVSDTVRHRRSRTPISAVSTDSNRESNVVMPDLLPKAGSTSNFSETSVRETRPREDKYSIVEVKERDLAMKILYRDIEFGDPRVDTINVFESCARFEPEQVETVTIIDASSDTDTATSTPKLKRKSLKTLNGSVDELKTELQVELEAVRCFDYIELPVEELSVKKQRTSFDGHKNLKGNERDVLRDSEIAEGRAIKLMKLRPTLKELWMEERNSFYGPDNDNDEPLEFSDDDEIPRYSIEMDSDSDVVVHDYKILHSVYLKKSPFLSS